MSKKMRPIKEIWGIPTSLFLEPDQVLILLTHVAGAAGVEFDYREDGNCARFWADPGDVFLGYLVKHARKRFGSYSIDKGLPEEECAALAHNIVTLEGASSRTPLHFGHSYTSGIFWPP